MKKKLSSFCLIRRRIRATPLDQLSAFHGTLFDEQALLYGDAALVLCEEELEGGTLAASNFFVREDGVWRIAHHHAGQIVRRQAERRRPSRLN